MALVDLLREVRPGASTGQLHPGELGYAASVTLFASVVPLLTRMPLTRLERLLRPRRAPTRRNDAERRVAVVESVLRTRPLRTVGRTCLTRGLTRWVFLNRAGIPAELVFGAGRPTDSGFAGHCWIEIGATPYLEAIDPRPRFAEMVRFRAHAGGQT
jgi:hypothetical protein